MPLPRKQEHQPWLISPSCLLISSPAPAMLEPQEGVGRSQAAYHATDLAETRAVGETPVGLGRSHATQHETDLEKPNALGETRMGLETSLPLKKPFKETVEALVNLEARITMQHANLETAIVGSFREVVTVCSHLVRQCDTLVAQMSRLETFVMNESQHVSLTSTDGEESHGNCGDAGKTMMCDLKVVEKIKTGALAKIDQGTQTEESTVSVASGTVPGAFVKHQPTDNNRLLPGRTLSNIMLLKGRRDMGDTREFQQPPLYGQSHQERTSCTSSRASGRRGPVADFMYKLQGGNQGNLQITRNSVGLDINLDVEGGAANLLFGSEANYRLPTNSQQNTPKFSPSYVTDHWATRVALHPRVLKFSLCIVFLDAVYIGIEAQHNNAKSLYRSPWVYIIMSNLFCMFYVLEWIVHLAAFRHRYYAITQASHFVDTALAVVTALNTWVIEPLLFYHDATIVNFFGPSRLVRLVFLARFTRFVKAVPQLLTLSRCVLMATKAVFWTCVMVVVVTYIFAIVMFTILEDEPTVNEEMGARNFDSLWNSMWTLLVDGALIEEFGVKMTILQNRKSIKTTLAWLAMSCYMFIAALTILNMLIGVMNEVVSSITDLEKTEAAIELMRETILKQLLKFDDGNGMISQYELECVLTDAESESVLKSLKVDRLFLLELQQMLFPDDNSQVTISAVVELMLLCRGDNQTTVRTLASGLLYISSLIYKLDAHMAQATKLATRSLDTGSRSPKRLDRISGMSGGQVSHFDFHSVASEH